MVDKKFSGGTCKTPWLRKMRFRNSSRFDFKVTSKFYCNFMINRITFNGLKCYRTRLEDIESRVRRRRLALFGHVARMQPGIPAHDALWTAIGARCGSAPGPGWKRPRGRPRTTWAEQLSRDLDGMGLWEAWYLALDRESGGSSRRAFASQT